MPEQPSTLAARIRAKYPGAYDDIADMELEQRVAAKFPGVYDDVTRTEPSLTRERTAPGAPSAMGATHHPETLTGGRHAEGLRAIQDAELPSDAAFLRRAPEVGGAAGMMLGGPLGAGAGAAAGSLVKEQFDRGVHIPTGGAVGSAALEGGGALVLGGAPGVVARGARTIGPAVAKHAGGISRVGSALAGVGSGIATANPITGYGTAAAARQIASPGAIKAAGNLATRAANVPAHAANKAGFGAISANAFRQALLDALGADPASTVP